MPKGNEYTTKFNIDITDLKKGMQQANQLMKVANSEFKAATGGMDKWGNSADGLSAKLKQLNTVHDLQKAKLEILQSEYKKVVEAEGENSKGAQDLYIKMNNLKGEIGKTEVQINKYSTQLSNMQREQEQAANSAEESVNAYDKLKQTISEQESELGKLKGAYSAVALEQGENSEEAQKLGKEIQQLSSELQENKAKINEAENAADGFDESLNDMGDAAEDAAGGFTVMKGALAELIADGIKTAAGAFRDLLTSSSEANANFQAQTGVSAKKTKEFSAEMQDLYKNNYGESLQDIGDKMAYVKQVTGEFDSSKIREVTENAMALEDTFGSDFNETVRGVSNLMQHFGIDAETAFDLFAQGSQKGLDYTGELGDNIAEYGGNFQQAGYSAEEYFQLLVNGSQGGAYNLDKVNDSINEVKNRIGDGTIKESLSMFSGDTEKAFKVWESGKGTMKSVIDSIVSDINNCTNEQDALNMAATAFGTMGEDANLQVVKSLTTTGDAFADIKGKMEEVKEIKFSDIGSQFQEIGRIIQVDFLQPLVDAVLPGVQDFLGAIIDNMPQIKQAFSDGLQTLKEWSPVIAGIGTAIATYFVATKIMGFVSAIKTMITAFTTAPTVIAGVKAAMAALNITLAANPIGLIVAAIAGLIAGLVLAYNKVDWFREGVNSAFTTIKTIGLTILNTLVSFFTVTLPNGFNTAVTAVSTFVSSVISFFTGLPGAIGTAVNAALTTVATWGGNLIQKGIETGANFVNGIMQFFNDLPYNVGYAIGLVIGTIAKWAISMGKKATETGKNFLDNLVEFFTQLPGKISAFVTNTYNNVTKWASNMKSKAIETGKNFLNSVVQFITQLPGKVANFLTNTISKVTSWASTMGSKARDAGSKFVSNVIDFITQLPGKVASFLSQVISKVTTWASTMLSKGKQAAADFGDAVINGLKSIPGKVGSIGKDIVTGLWNGIAGAGDWIRRKVGDFASGILDGMKSALGINSPSRLFRDEVGKMIPAGVAAGIQKNTKSAVKAVRNMSKKLIPATEGLKTGITGISSGRNTTGTMKNTEKTLVFNQYNNSPKALSRLEIYRQTKNQLAFAKGV